MVAPSRRALAVALTIAAACGPRAEDGARHSPLVYGVDGRTELFDVADPAQRALMSQSMVALVPKDAVHVSGGALTIDAPSWGQAANLCPDERFGAQPAAAFCTGVLVDWDLVLTAGHCVRLLAPSDFVVVFGYDYEAAGVLDADASVRRPTKIVAEALDPAGTEPRLDFAWLRLDQPATAPRRPAPVHTAAAPLAVGAPLVSIGAGGGVPLKLDATGSVRDARAAQLDYFVADTDTARGSSGGGAFDGGLALAGVLARGGQDLAPTDRGCMTTVVAPDGTTADEQFTYAFRAIQALCATTPSPSTICRADCGDPCVALAAPEPSGGCTMSGAAPDLSALLLLVSLAHVRRRRLTRPPL